jgi:hypothetical protein
MEAQNILVRYSNPTKYDLAPQGTIWKVCVDDKKNYCYIQLGTENDVSEWKLMGEFLEKAFLPFFADEKTHSQKFVEHCLDLYFNQSNKDPISPVTICNTTKK